MVISETVGGSSPEERETSAAAESPTAAGNGYTFDYLSAVTPMLTPTMVSPSFGSITTIFSGGVHSPTLVGVSSDSEIQPPTNIG